MQKKIELTDLGLKMKLKIGTYRILRCSLLAASLIFAMGVGVFLGLKSYPPIPQLRSLKAWLAPATYEKVTPKSNDVSGLIQIGSVDDVQRLRQALIKKIWGTAQLPSQFLPIKISKDSEPSLKYTHLLSSESYCVELEWGLNSIVHRLLPEHANGETVLYHEGHGGDHEEGKLTIERCLAQGYEVYAFAMPLYGRNNTPIVNSPRFGRFRVFAHSQLHLLPPASGSSLRYFLDPVLAIMNFIELQGVKKVSMIGLSGGAWTTVVYSAVDTRLTNSYPVAGPLPVYHRTKWYMLGDREDLDGDLLFTANYPELYLLACAEPNRRQLQFFNEFDPAGGPGREFSWFEQAVQDKIKALPGGYFKVHIDKGQRKHVISKKSLKIIIMDLAKRHS